ncbi:MAG: DNRLRE domain-containing protein [Candidatus Bathyarchaeia archaeon]
MVKAPTIIYLIVLCSIPCLTSIHGYASEEVTLYPIADSYVSSLHPNNNYGGSSSLFAEYGIADDFQYIGKAYLMFDLAGLPQGTIVESATLTIHVSSVSSTMKVYLHFCQDVSWGELEINWRNAPRYVDKPVGTVLMAKSMEFYPIDATEAVRQALSKGLSRVTLVVTTELKTGLFEGIQFDSRESAIGEYWPKLRIVYSVGASTTRTATETKSGTVGTPVSMATLVRTMWATATETVTKMETLRESFYFTVTRRAEAPSPSFMAAAFAAGAAVGVLATHLIKPKHLKTKPPLGEAPEASELGVMHCPYCGGELRSLGATGKSVCPRCGRIYG